MRLMSRHKAVLSSIVMMLSGTVAIATVTLLVTGCASGGDDRLTPSGVHISVPQTHQFCNDNPGDPICSK